MSDDSTPARPRSPRTTDDTIDRSRRAILRATVGAGALLLGSGVASADGQGGQAVVCDEDFRPDGSFVITEVSGCPPEARNPDGSCWAPPLYFQCNGNGGRVPPGKDGKIPFPYWHFNYVDDPDDADPRKLYSRDNEVRTGVTYRWPGNEKRCPGTNDCASLVQTGFTAGGGAD